MVVFLVQLLNAVLAIQIADFAKTSEGKIN